MKKTMDITGTAKKARGNYGILNNCVNSSFGFTFIELLVVLSVIGILSVVGIAAFVDYDRKQALNTASLELFTLLQAAKSRSQSQVKPAGGVCLSNSLDGYKVTIDSITKKYELVAVCGGLDYSPAIISKTLPTKINFDAGNPAYIFFNALTGGVNQGTITISSDFDGNSRNISITSTGAISESP